MESAIGIAIGIVIGLIGSYFATRSLLANQFGGPAGMELGKKVAARANTDPAFAKKLDELFNPPPPKPSGEPIRLLGLLQREARLLDFLMENLTAYDDQQIGASVRDIQAKSQATIKKHLTLEPVMGQEEGSSVTVPAGFEPSSVRLVGNVSGQPPFHGTLQHAGWRVRTINLPKPEGQDEFVLMPAEVELT
ncbi:MAG: DUF2760 domain-containing protein [Zavarzinella sp.]|nr:DUF2760 domain-containing protein [Zavarzinella sp.]